MSMIPNYPALVLNADHRPVRVHPLSIWPFDRAMRAVLRGKVTVLAEYNKIFRSPSLEWNPPSVVALKNYVKVPTQVAFNRLNIFVRDEFRCQYCGETFSPKDLTFDHVIPRKKGGRHAMDNVVAACAPCNSRKGDEIWTPLKPPRIPDSYEMARKTAKRKQLIKGELHADWVSYLYWSGVLEKDKDDEAKQIADAKLGLVSAA